MSNAAQSFAGKPVIDRGRPRALIRERGVVDRPAILLSKEAVLALYRYAVMNPELNGSLPRGVAPSFSPAGGPTCRGPDNHNFAR